MSTPKKESLKDKLYNAIHENTRLHDVITSERKANKEYIRELKTEIKVLEHSQTVTVEQGDFTRVMKRQDKKRTQKTIRRIKTAKNTRIVIGNLFGLEIYIYPYDFPDKIFLGQWHNDPKKRLSLMVEKVDLPKGFQGIRRIQWYLNGGLKTVLSGKSRFYLAGRILKAYNNGLKLKMDDFKQRKK